MIQKTIHLREQEDGLKIEIMFFEGNLADVDGVCSSFSCSDPDCFFNR